MSSIIFVKDPQTADYYNLSKANSIEFNENRDEVTIHFDLVFFTITHPNKVEQIKELVTFI